MTIEMLEDVAMDVLKKQKFDDKIPLFEMDDVSDYEVTDGTGSMPLCEFIEQYTEILIEIFKECYK